MLASLDFFFLSLYLLVSKGGRMHTFPMYRMTCKQGKSETICELHIATRKEHVNIREVSYFRKTVDQNKATFFFNFLN